MMVVQLTRVQFCDPKDCSQPASSVHEISQARILVCCYFLIPGSGRSSREENDNPHQQYSCLQNPMDRGTWRATVHGVAKSQTRMSDQQQTTLLPSSRGSSQPSDKTHVSPLQAVSYTAGRLFTATREAHQVLLKKNGQFFLEKLRLNTYELAKNLILSQKKLSEKLVTAQPQNFFE